MRLDGTRALRLVAAATVTLVVASMGTRPLGAQSTVAQWRMAHEREIVDEFIRLLSVPNVARNDADMRRNAELLAAMFRRRGFTVETTEGPGSPVVFARLDVQPSRGTLTLYIHYDGRPVDSAGWTRCGPFAPAVELLASGSVDPRPLIEKRYPLADSLAAFEHAARPGALKILVDCRPD